MTQKKTNEKVVIPISPRLKTILTQYNNQPPRFEDLTQFNRIIRQLCLRAGIDQPVTYTRIQGNRKTEVTYPKYELVSSHTCRRSFCTNLFREDGINARLIMSISGHRTERAFMRYLKIDQEFAADALERVMG